MKVTWSYDHVGVVYGQFMCTKKLSTDIQRLNTLVESDIQKSLKFKGGNKANAKYESHSDAELERLN